MAELDTASQTIQIDDESQNTKTSKPKAPVERAPGRSLFPIARVQKILKADKDLDGIAKEAVFVVAMATEKFIARMSEAARSQAGREKRATVQRKDILTVTRREEEYFFLGDILEEASKLPFAVKKNPFEKQPVQATDDVSVAKATLDPDADAEDEETQDVELEDAQSEMVSLPPSSRPPSPRSEADTQSEPVDFDMDDEEED